MFTLLSWLIFGVIVGYIAKIIHPGDEPVGFLPTVVIGVAGSYVGGIIGSLINGNLTSGNFETAGFLMSIIGGVICCAAWRWYNLKFASEGKRNFFTGKKL